jgi:hypothetical protein
MTDIARRESEILLYTAPDGAVKVGVLFRDESAWLTQRSLAELFGVGVPAVNKHLKNSFESGELAESSAVSMLETTAADGKNYLLLQPRRDHRGRLSREQLPGHVHVRDVAARADDAHIFAVRFETMRKRLLRRRGFFDRWKRRQHAVAMVRP